MVSELITNAVVHALPPATLRVSRAADGGCRAVRVEVTDTALQRRAAGRWSSPTRMSTAAGSTSSPPCRRDAAHESIQQYNRWAELPAA